MSMTIKHLDGTMTTISFIERNDAYEVFTLGPGDASKPPITAAGSKTWLDLAKEYAQPGDSIRMDYNDYGGFDPDASAIPDITASQIAGS